MICCICCNFESIESWQIINTSQNMKIMYLFDLPYICRIFLVYFPYYLRIFAVYLQYIWCNLLYLQYFYNMFIYMLYFCRIFLVYFPYFQKTADFLTLNCNSKLQSLFDCFWVCWLLVGEVHHGAWMKLLQNLIISLISRTMVRSILHPCDDSPTLPNN